MRSLLLLAVVLLAFGFPAQAQEKETGASGTSASTSASSAGVPATAPNPPVAPPANSKKSAAAAVIYQVTGCLAKDTSGKGFTLVSGRYKQGVAVISEQDLAVHVGHMVKLTGTWQEPAPAGTAAAAPQTRTFKASKAEHVADKCTVGPDSRPREKSHWIPL